MKQKDKETLIQAIFMDFQSWKYFRLAGVNLWCAKRFLFVQNPSLRNRSIRYMSVKTVKNSLDSPKYMKIFLSHFMGNKFDDSSFYVIHKLKPSWNLCTFMCVGLWFDRIFLSFSMIYCLKVLYVWYWYDRHVIEVT